MPGGRDRPDRKDRLGFAVSLAAIIAGVVVLVLVLAGRGESHPHGDPGLIPLVDGAHVIAAHDDCSDETDFGYVKNNSCIDYRLVQSSTHETVTTLLAHEARALDRPKWLLFSPADFGFTGSVVGRADLYGHDCVLLGPPAQIPLSMEDTDTAPIPTFWGMLRRKLKLAQRKAYPIIGLQIYPGPANEPDHRVC
jgi:hypothetical protein